MALDDLYDLSRRFLRTKYREYVRKSVGSFSAGPRLVIVTGQRGVGKTTRLVQIVRERYADALATPKVMYLPCDHIVVGKRSVYDIAEDFALAGGELLCLDEIHKVPDWGSVLKSIYETFPGLAVIASGSSSLKLRAGAGDLSRRALLHHMPGLSLREYMELRLGMNLPAVSFEQILDRHEELALTVLDALSAGRPRILEVFAEYLRKGYYPYFADFDSVESFWQAVEQDAHVTLENDLMMVHPELTGNTMRKLRHLLSIISVSVPFTPDLGKLKKAVDVVDDRTLKSYLGYLEDGGLIRMLAKGKPALRGLMKPEKIYLDNTNQQFALCPGLQVNVGTLRETFFASMVSCAGIPIQTVPEGDFMVKQKYTVEVGGKGKDFSQIGGIPDSCLFLDEIEQGTKGRIPLWLVGFLY